MQCSRSHRRTALTEQARRHSRSIPRPSPVSRPTSSANISQKTLECPAVEVQHSLLPKKSVECQPRTIPGPMQSIPTESWSAQPRMLLRKTSLFPESHFSRKATSLEKPLFAKCNFSRGVAGAASLQSHFSRKATFLEKPLFAKSNFSRGVARTASLKSHFSRKNTLLEKPLFSKSHFSRDFSRDVGARIVFEKQLFLKSHPCSTATFFAFFLLSSDLSCGAARAASLKGTRADIAFIS